jgi:hypothetical protein
MAFEFLQNRPFFSTQPLCGKELRRLPLKVIEYFHRLFNTQGVGAGMLFQNVSNRDVATEPTWMCSRRF